MAPSLSRVPLFVRPSHPNHNDSEEDGDAALRETPPPPPQEPTRSPTEQEVWTDGMTDPQGEDHGFYSAVVGSGGDGGSDDEVSESTKLREQIRAATQRYLKRNVELKNVAHSEHPIGRRRTRQGGSTPTMEVSVIVYSHNDDDDDEEEDVEEEEDGSRDDGSENDLESNQRSAKLEMVRMVNRVPLLDGAEAAACGLVQGFTEKQSVWNSFGLHISATTESILYAPQLEMDQDDDEEDVVVPGRHFVPTYAVRDSDQVAPFFQSSTHDLYDDEEDDESEDDDESMSRNEDVFESGAARRKRKKRSARKPLLPAHLRLGNILVMIQINAEPCSLPLPTLSKVNSSARDSLPCLSYGRHSFFC